jgi:voltage-gated potassium channel
MSMRVPSPSQTQRQRARREPSARVRWRVLAQFETRFEPLMAILGLVWLALFVLDVTRGLDPLLTGLSTVIWFVFIGDYAVRLLVAPDRAAYLRRSWLTALSLVIPALRIGRLFAAVRMLRAARAVRGVRLIRAVASVNRGMHALGRAIRRRGVGYVVALTTAVTLAGAAGMYALEPHAPHGEGFDSYGDALWWTAMIVTTLGSAYWPRTLEGRILAFLISLFAIGVFGYITASLASFFVDRDAASADSDTARASELRALRREIRALRDELRDGPLTGDRAGPRPPRA